MSNAVAASAARASASDGTTVTACAARNCLVASRANEAWFSTHRMVIVFSVGESACDAGSFAAVTILPVSVRGSQRVVRDAVTFPADIGHLHLLCPRFARPGYTGGSVAA